MKPERRTQHILDQQHAVIRDAHRVIAGRFPALSCTDNADGDVAALRAG
jgi:hypothetical protein